MNTKEKFVVTINRELGSGGRTVGEKVAAKLGVSFYDKAVIKSLTAKYHLSTEAIENLKGRLLFPDDQQPDSHLTGFDCAGLPKSFPRILYGQLRLRNILLCKLY